MTPLARQYNPNPDGAARFWMTRHACREDQAVSPGLPRGANDYSRRRDR